MPDTTVPENTALFQGEQPRETLMQPYRNHVGFVAKQGDGHVFGFWDNDGLPLITREKTDIPALSLPGLDLFLNSGLSTHLIPSELQITPFTLHQSLDSTARTNHESDDQIVFRLKVTDSKGEDANLILDESEMLAGFVSDCTYQHVPLSGSENVVKKAEIMHTLLVRNGDGGLSALMVEPPDVGIFTSNDEMFASLAEKVIADLVITEGSTEKRYGAAVVAAIRGVTPHAALQLIAKQGKNIVIGAQRFSDLTASGLLQLNYPDKMELMRKITGIDLDSLSTADLLNICQSLATAQRNYDSFMKHGGRSYRVRTRGVSVPRD